MKGISSLFFALFIVAARADSTNLPPINLALTPTDTAQMHNDAAPLQSIDIGQWSLSGSLNQPDLTPMLTLAEKPNELRLGKITLSGSLVEAVKVPNPLQLFNPWAPREYGETLDNAAISPITNRVTGWKVFAFEF
jgi:hypothetical protein